MRKNLLEVESMMNGLLEVKTGKTRVFQVLLLKNDKHQNVEVQEDEHVDFPRIQEHLQQGGSVFITSKTSQKLVLPKERKKEPRNKSTRCTITAFYFDHI